MSPKQKLKWSAAARQARIKIVDEFKEELIEKAESLVRDGDTIVDKNEVEYAKLIIRSSSSSKRISNEIAIALGAAILGIFFPLGIQEISVTAKPVNVPLAIFYFGLSVIGGLVMIAAHYTDMSGVTKLYKSLAYRSKKSQKTIDNDLTEPNSPYDGDETQEDTSVFGHQGGGKSDNNDESGEGMRS